jgi:hypothetical protein
MFIMRAGFSVCGQCAALNPAPTTTLIVMETSEIIALVVSSSVLSAILSGFVNLRIQNLNYKREYYKKLIERRIHAQDQILNLFNELRIQVKLDNGILCNRICATGEEYFDSFVRLIATSVNISFWLSEDLSGILLDFNIFLLNEITHEIQGQNKNEREKSLVNLGILHHEKLREFRSKLERQLMKDFAGMSNVNSFIKSKHISEDKLYWLKK